MTSPTSRRVLLPAAALLTVLIAGCSGTAETPTAPEPAPTTAQAAELPPGAEDVWDLDLSGNLIDDVSEHMDIDRLTGEDGVFTATQFFANQVTSVCMADTDRLSPGLESKLERGVRMAMGSNQVEDGERYVRILTSYGCPDLSDEVDTAITRAS